MLVRRYILKSNISCKHKLHLCWLHTICCYPYLHYTMIYFRVNIKNNKGNKYALLSFFGWCLILNKFFTSNIGKWSRSCILYILFTNSLVSPSQSFLYFFFPASYLLLFQHQSQALLLLQESRNLTLDVSDVFATQTHREAHLWMINCQSEGVFSTQC